MCLMDQMWVTGEKELSWDHLGPAREICPGGVMAPTRGGWLDLDS